MNNGIPKIPERRNYVPEQYKQDSPERLHLQEALRSLLAKPVEIPVIAGGKAFYTGNTKEIRAPHDRNLVLGIYHEAGPEEIDYALTQSKSMAKAWAAMDWEDRAAIFLKAAALIEHGYKYTLNAATMLGQSKNCFQAEVDASAETSDFFTNNAVYASNIYSRQPASTAQEFNRLEYRPLEGFVYAISPFNFTAIAANLASSPALMGNTVMWKPASTAVLSNWYLAELYRMAGLPDGVINFLPGRASQISRLLLARPELAGLHFTGSTAVFNALWREVANQLPGYHGYPRLVGETGGKDFVCILPDADLDSAIPLIIKGAFEYQGQKCSAASRLYIPASKAKETIERLVAEASKIKLGSPLDFDNFMNAVIDEAAFSSINAEIEMARQTPGCTILYGGGKDDSQGWFIEPTLILSTDPLARPMTEEIFGPVLTMYVYEDSKLADLYKLIDSTSPYALTGSIFARNRGDIAAASASLANAAGNFYINDKPSGAVVGRQPFGGGRASGTNDKAGSEANLLRWVSPRNIKENFLPQKDWKYGYMS